MNTLWGWGRASWAGCGPDVRRGGQTLIMGYSADKSPLIGHLAGPLRRLEPLGAQRQEKCGPNRPTPTGYSCNNAGLRRYVVFVVIELTTRRGHSAGLHPQPDGRWLEQLARNLTDPVDGFLRTARQLMHDRDPLYTRGFGAILTSGDVEPIRLPPKRPNLNASAERFVRSIKEECLHRVVPLGEGHVHLIVHEYVEHDHRERNHQGLDNQLRQRPPPPGRSDADVQRRERLGGLLRFYYREAA